nr:hypothetical protein [Methylomonas koyamae]
MNRCRGCTAHHRRWRPSRPKNRRTQSVDPFKCNEFDVVFDGDDVAGGGFVGEYQIAATLAYQVVAFGLVQIQRIDTVAAIDAVFAGAVGEAGHRINDIVDRLVLGECIVAFAAYQGVVAFAQQ